MAVQARAVQGRAGQGRWAGPCKLGTPPTTCLTGSLFGFGVLKVAHDGIAPGVPFWVGPRAVNFMGTSAYVFEGVPPMFHVTATSTSQLRRCSVCALSSRIYSASVERVSFRPSNRLVH